MYAKDVPPTRLAAAQEAVRRFLAKLPNRYRVGVVAFSSEPQVVAPVTRDRDVVLQAVDSLFAGRGTAIGDALARSVELARTAATDGTAGTDAPTGTPPASASGTRPVTAILLLSDGSQTTGLLQPSDGAAQAKAAGIPVYTVALGTPDGTVTIERFGFSRVIPVPPDPFTLQQIAKDTNGEFFAVSTGARLSAVYEHLGSRIGSYRTKREETDKLIAAGAALLIGAGLLGAIWLPRFP
jgi:Ca-activated chloride channel family protein